MTKEERYDEAAAIYENGDLDAAFEKMNQLCLDFPDFSLPHTALSVWCFKKGLYEDSLAHARKFADLEPEDQFSYVALSILAQRAGDHATAEDALMKSRFM